MVSLGDEELTLPSSDAEVEEMLLRNVRVTMEMIKWEHSIFALPFALTGAMLAANGWPPFRKLILIIVCMISARTAAMAFNRYADADIDSSNPRTRTRAIPSGLLRRSFVGWFTLFFGLIFLLAASLLNRLTMILSPFVLCLLLGYSYTKRFTSFSHLVLGLCLGLAPMMAWIAVAGSVDARILVLTLGVLLWVAGFDVLYACQDFLFDRHEGLFSLPAWLGLDHSFMLSRGMHLLAFLLFLTTVWLFHLGPIAFAGVLVVGALLIYEHLLISPRDLSGMNTAFLLMNGVISCVFFIFVALALSIHHL